MKVVILAGGRGTRISEETQSKPKVLVEIGGKPIIWHLMKYFSNQGFNEFVVCLGYKGDQVKDFFCDFVLRNADLYVDLAQNSIDILKMETENWKVSLIDTGESSNTGERLSRVQPYLHEERSFFFTYGDGLSDVNLNKLHTFHKKAGKVASLTAVRPPGRFGALRIDAEQNVTSFEEKVDGENSRINGGFFVLDRKVFEYISGDNPSFEYETLPKLSRLGELAAYKHDGFWHAMDTVRDRDILNSSHERGETPWLSNRML